ncbi:MAG: cupin domain-containing protein [Alphaproteobacteria bacterium]|nr:cupin domain-containing protein [Alphaproteobacteria bacterium]MBF0250200.1 cupin domain-containing protein [Alphaproteobacteria bacterium]
MMIEVCKPSTAQIRDMSGEPTWEKEVSTFPWRYDMTEICLVLEGEVTVTPDGGEPVRFGAGDLVTFPKGMTCTWDITKTVRKHYRFL